MLMMHLQLSQIRKIRILLLKYNTIKDIFLGKIKNWKEINPKSELGDIRVIFDNKKSGNIRYFKEQFDIKDSLP